MKKNNYFQNVFDQQLEVLVIGDLKKNTPTVVLLHEGLGSLEMWKGIPEELFKELDLNIFAYSRAGYGKSSIINLPRPINYMNLEAEKYLPKLDKSRFSSIREIPSWGEIFSKYVFFASLKTFNGI